VRFPFWKCVIAVDAELPRLHLIDHLLTMVNRATSIRPGPLVALSKMADAGNLTETERLLFGKLVDHFKREPALAPNNVVDFIPVLTKVQLPFYERIATTAFQKLHSDRTAKYLLGNLAYCAFQPFSRSHATPTNGWPSVELRSKFGSPPFRRAVSLMPTFTSTSK
jgi:hypothetical protein